MTGKKYFDDQHDGEEMLLLFRRHPVVMRKALIFSMIPPLLGTLPATFRPELGLSGFFIGLGIGILIGGAVLFYKWISWYFSVFIVTNERFIQVTQSGLFSKGVVDIAIDQIQMVNYQIDGLQETLLGFGTLSVQTQVGELSIHNVHKPAKIQKELTTILRSETKVSLAEAQEDEQEE